MASSATRSAARAVGWTAVSVIALVASLAAHTRTALFLRAVHDTTNTALADVFRGKLTIGRIERIDLDRVVVRHVIIYDPAGRRVIVADRVEAVPNVAALLRGVIALDHVRLRGGTVRLVTEEGNPIPSLAMAFFPKTPSTGPAGPSPTVRLRDIQIDELVAYGDVPGVRGLRAEHVHARGDLSFEDDLLELRLRDVRMHVVHPYRPSVELSGGYGLITTDPHRTVELHADMRSRPTTGREPDRARALVRVFLPEGAPEGAPQHIEVLVHAHQVSPS